MKRIFLYGISGAHDQYRVVKYWCFFNIDEEPVTIGMDFVVILELP